MLFTVIQQFPFQYIPVKINCCLIFTVNTVNMRDIMALSGFIVHTNYDSEEHRKNWH